MKIGDLVRATGPSDQDPRADMYMKSLGVGCLIEVIASHRDWDGDSVCKVYWSGAGEIHLRRAIWVEEAINESR
tara:strand:+ start:1881 stop:2102 length:222 start_codon:yes stop_codon:yes gene_type:complete